MHVNSLSCVGVKGGERVCFSINCGMRRFYHASWLFDVYMDAVMRGANWDGEDGSEISGGGRKVEIAWPFVCRGLSFMRRVGRRPEGDGEAFC